MAAFHRSLYFCYGFTTKTNRRPFSLVRHRFERGQWCLQLKMLLVNHAQGHDEITLVDF